MPIEATIDRFEGDWAVVRLDDGQELMVPKAELSADAHEGARLVLRFLSSVEAEDEQANKARQLLSDLLQSKS